MSFANDKKASAPPAPPHQAGGQAAQIVALHQQGMTYEEMRPILERSSEFKGTAPCEQPRHPIISWGEAARRLGVSKGHLNRVITGKRKGCAELRARYENLISEFTVSP